jgi:hypothetical protein
MCTLACVSHLGDTMFPAAGRWGLSEFAEATAEPAGRYESSGEGGMRVVPVIPSRRKATSST